MKLNDLGISTGSAARQLAALDPTFIRPVSMNDAPSQSSFGVTDLRTLEYLMQIGDGKIGRSSGIFTKGIMWLPTPTAIKKFETLQPKTLQGFLISHR